MGSWFHTGHLPGFSLDVQWALPPWVAQESAVGGGGFRVRSWGA